MIIQVPNAPPPWFCQYDNKLYPGGSCNMTSAAMAIRYYYPHSKTTPDDLLRECADRGWDRHSLEVIDAILENHRISDDSSKVKTIEEVKPHIKGGNLVIIQGDYTPSGHIVVVFGYDPVAGFWLVNDPAGKWENGRYNGWVSGKAVRYPSDWFRAKSAPDGKVWGHLLRKKGA